VYPWRECVSPANCKFQNEHSYREGERYSSHRQIEQMHMAPCPAAGGREQLDKQDSKATGETEIEEGHGRVERGLVSTTPLPHVRTRSTPERAVERAGPGSSMVEDCEMMDPNPCERREPPFAPARGDSADITTPQDQRTPREVDRNGGVVPIVETSIASTGPGTSRSEEVHPSQSSPGGAPLSGCEHLQTGTCASSPPNWTDSVGPSGAMIEGPVAEEESGEEKGVTSRASGRPCPDSPMHSASESVEEMGLLSSKHAAEVAGFPETLWPPPVNVLTDVRLGDDDLADEPAPLTPAEPDNGDTTGTDRPYTAPRRRGDVVPDDSDSSNHTVRVRQNASNDFSGTDGKYCGELSPPAHSSSKHDGVSPFASDGASPEMCDGKGRASPEPPEGDPHLLERHASEPRAPRLMPDQCPASEAVPTPGGHGPPPSDALTSSPPHGRWQIASVTSPASHDMSPPTSLALGSPLPSSSSANQRSESPEAPKASPVLSDASPRSIFTPESPAAEVFPDLPAALQGSRSALSPGLEPLQPASTASLPESAAPRKSLSVEEAEVETESSSVLDDGLQAPISEPDQPSRRSTRGDNRLRTQIAEEGDASEGFSAPTTPPKVAKHSAGRPEAHTSSERLEATIRDSYTKFGLDGKLLHMRFEPQPLDPMAINLGSPVKARSKLSNDVVKKLRTARDGLLGRLAGDLNERNIDLIQRLCNFSFQSERSGYLKGMVETLCRQRNIAEDNLSLVNFLAYSGLAVMRYVDDPEVGY